MTAVEMLGSNAHLAKYHRLSEQRLDTVREKFEECVVLADESLTVFCAGSLGRDEYTKRSDLDLFAVTMDDEPGKLTEVRVLSAIADLNDELGFPPFSQAMRYLRLYRYKDLVDHTGKPIDDSENSFTTRMLLMLESKYLTHRNQYETVLEGVSNNYFRDNVGKKEFRPLFLINDMLRYWRTLCLNYEQCRVNTDLPWRKRNICLKFSRMVTVFSTICLMMLEGTCSSDEFKRLAMLTPLQRLARAVDDLEDVAMIERFDQFLDNYAKFLMLKSFKDPEQRLQRKQVKQDVRGAADATAQFLFDCLMHKKNAKLARYLVL